MDAADAPRGSDGPPRGLGIALFALLAVAYLERTGISYAIVPMGEEFELSSTQKGLILAAFSWGYVGAMLPMGMCIDRFGGGRVLQFAVWSWAALSWLGALASSAWQVLILRLGLGIAEAPVSPASAKIIAMKYPLERRGRGMATFDGGSYLGLAAGAPIVGFAGSQFGWRWTFVVLGLVAVTWVVFWRYSSIGRWDTSIAESSKRQMEHVSLWRILRQPSIYPLAIGFFSYNYVKSFFLTWLPSFLIFGLGYSDRASGLIGTLPGLCALVSIFASGALIDHAVAEGINRIRIQRVIASVGIGGGMALWPIASMGTGFASVIGLTMVFSLCIAASPAIWGLVADLAPGNDAVGRLGAVQNSVSNCAGILAPILTGVLLDQTGSYSAPLMVTAAIALLGGLLYLTAGRVSWRP